MIVLQRMFWGSQKTYSSVQNVEETLDRNNSSAEDVLGKAQRMIVLQRMYWVSPKTYSSVQNVQEKPNKIIVQHRIYWGSPKNLQFCRECIG